MAKLTTRNLNVRIQVIDPVQGIVPSAVQTIAEGNLVTASNVTTAAAPLGDMVTFTGVSAEVDGKPYYIAANDGTVLTLKGKVDLPIGAPLGANMYVWGNDPMGSNPLDLMPAFCISKISGDPIKAGAEINAKTFCGSEKMAGAPEAGSISFSGYMEDSSRAYDEFEKAALDGKQRIMEVTFPDQAVFYFPICVSGFTFAIDPDAYVTFDASAILTDFFTKISLVETAAPATVVAPLVAPVTPTPVTPTPVTPEAVATPEAVVEPTVVDPTVAPEEVVDPTVDPTV